MSHPMWVRGLKLLILPWSYLLSQVAPHVGAWIETSPKTHQMECGLSHPMWVRGLKHLDL